MLCRHLGCYLPSAVISMHCVQGRVCHCRENPYLQQQNGSIVRPWTKTRENDLKWGSMGKIKRGLPCVSSLTAGWAETRMSHQHKAESDSHVPFIVQPDGFGHPFFFFSTIELGHVKVTLTQSVTTKVGQKHVMLSWEGCGWRTLGAVCAISVQRQATALTPIWALTTYPAWLEDKPVNLMADLRGEAAFQ